MGRAWISTSWPLLRTPAGVAALAGGGRGWPAATRWPRRPPLRSAGDRRPTLAAAALTQADAAPPGGGQVRPGRRRGCSSPGPGWSRPPGAVVADAPRGPAAAAGVRTLADLGCGLGADAIAAARAGIAVYAVEADPATAALAAANAEAPAAGRPLHGGVRATPTAVRRVRRGRGVLRPGPRGAGRPAGLRPGGLLAAVGLRRRAGRAGRRARCSRWRPGIDHALIPAGAEARVGQRRRRCGRGGALVRPAGRGTPPGHPRTLAPATERSGASSTGDGGAGDGAGRRRSRSRTCTTRTARWSGRTSSPSSPPPWTAGWPTRHRLRVRRHRRRHPVRPLLRGDRRAAVLAQAAAVAACASAVWARLEILKRGSALDAGPAAPRPAAGRPGLGQPRADPGGWGAHRPALPAGRPGLGERFRR